MAEEEGRISWSAELSDKGFQEGARRMQQEINRITQEVDKSGVAVDRFTDGMDDMADSTRKVKKETDNLSSSFNNLTKYAAGFFTLAAAKDFAKKVFDVRSEIQNLQTSFRILVGEKDKADELFNSIREFATKTPMQMKDLASAAQTMMGFGLPVEQLMENLKALGDISGGDTQRFQSLALAFSQASSAGKLMGQDLMQMINAGFNPLSIMSEKTGKSIAQLKDEMSKGAISADMLRQSLIDATSEGGKFYGMLDAKSKQLGGAFSNLQGAITDMFNEIGENTEGLMAGAIEAATLVVQNYEKVGKAILFIVATYGEYKAALMVNIALEKAQAFNRLAHVKGMTALQLATDILTKKTAALNAVIMANPYVLLATAVMSAATAYVLFRKRTDEVTEAQNKLNGIREDATVKVEEEKVKLEELRKVAMNEQSTLKARQDAISQLNSIIPNYNAQLDVTTGKYIENKKALDAYLVSLGKKYEMEGAKDQLRQIGKEIAQTRLDIAKAKQDVQGAKNLQAGTGRKSAYNQSETMFLVANTSTAEAILDDANARLKTKLKERQLIYDTFGTDLVTEIEGTSPTPGGGGGGKGGKKGGGGRNNVADAAAERIRTELELAEAVMKARVETENSITEAYIAAIEDDAEREREERRHQHEIAVRDIETQEEDFYKSLYEARKKAYENGNKGRYENTEEGAAGWSAAAMAGTLTEKEQKQYVTALKKMHAQLEKENAEYSRSVARDIAEEERTNKEAISSYLKQYGDYAQKKQAIYSDANDRICEYEKQLSQATTEEGRAAAQARIDTVKEETKAQISELDIQYGKAKAFMVDLFEDTSSKSINAINAIIEKYEALLKFMKGDGSVTRGTLLDFGFSDSEIDKALQNMKTNGVSSIKDITDALKNLKREVGSRSVWQQLKQDINDAADATDNGTKIQMMAQVALEAIPQFETLGDAIFSAFDIDDSQMKAATQSLKDFATVAKGIGQFKSGDKIGGFMSIASAIVSAAGQVASAIDAEKQKDRQRILSRIDHKLQITDERISELNETLSRSYGLEAQRVAEESRQQAKTKQQQALEGLMGVNVRGLGALGISELAKTLGEMYGLNYGKDRSGSTYGTVMGFMWSDLLNNNPAEDLIEMFIEQRDMIASVLGDEWDKILEYIDAMKDAQDTIKETMTMEKEQIVGTSFSSVFDDMLNAMYDLGDGAEDVFTGISDDWQQMINRMVINNMLAEDMRKDLQDWYDSWHEAWENDNDLTLEEQEMLRDSYNEIFKEYSDRVEQLRDMGIIKSIAKSEEEALEELEEATMDYLDTIRSAFEDLVSDSGTDMEEWSINLRNSILRNLIQSKLLNDEFDQWANGWAERYSNLMSDFTDGIIDETGYKSQLQALNEEFENTTNGIAEQSRKMWEAFGLDEKTEDEIVEKAKSAFDDLHQSFLSTLTDMNGDAEAWSKQITKTMVEQMVEKNILNDAFDGQMDEWKERFEDALTAGDTEGLKALRQELTDLRTTLAEQAQAYMEALGYVDDAIEETVEDAKYALSDLSDILVSSMMDVSKSAEDFGKDIGKKLIEQMISTLIDKKYAKRIESIQQMWEGVLNGTSKNTYSSVKREIERLYKAIGNDTKELTGMLKDMLEETGEATKTPLDDMRSMFRSSLMDMEADADDLGEDIGRALTEAFIEQFVLGDTFDKQVEEWKAAYEAIMGGGMSPEERASQLSQLKKTIADAREGYEEQAKLIHDLMGTGDYSDQKASVNMADKATYDQFETFLGMQTAMVIGQEQGNAVRIQILSTLQAMGGITSPDSSYSEQMRNMMMLANEYLLDIKRSNREMQAEFGAALNQINNKLSRL